MRRSYSLSPWTLFTTLSDVVAKDPSFSSKRLQVSGHSNLQAWDLLFRSCTLAQHTEARLDSENPRIMLQTLWHWTSGTEPPRWLHGQHRGAWPRSPFFGSVALRHCCNFWAFVKQKHYYLLHRADEGRKQNGDDEWVRTIVGIKYMLVFPLFTGICDINNDVLLRINLK